MKTRQPFSSNQRQPACESPLYLYIHSQDEESQNHHLSPLSNYSASWQVKPSYLDDCGSVITTINYFSTQWVKLMIYQHYQLLFNPYQDLSTTINLINYQDLSAINLIKIYQLSQHDESSTAPGALHGQQVINHLGVSWIHVEIRLGDIDEVSWSCWWPAGGCREVAGSSWEVAG